MEDATRVFVAEVVQPTPLPFPEHTQGRCGQLRCERHRLQAGKEAIAAEHGHEPRQAGGRQTRPSAISGEKRKAARSTRLRRYVAFSGSQSHSTRGASSSHRSRFRCMRDECVPSSAQPLASRASPQTRAAL